MTPVGPMARTFSTCLPRRSFGGLNGETQGLNPPLSSSHWKVEPAWVDVNLNFGRRLVVFFFGPLVIVVSGAGVWTANDLVVVAELPDQAGRVAPLAIIHDDDCKSRRRGRRGGEAVASKRSRGERNGR